MGQIFTGHKVVVSIFLFTFWIAVEEKLQFAELLSGVMVTVLVIILTEKLSFNTSNNIKISSESIFRFINYTFLLFRDIIAANFEVAKIVLSPRMGIKPLVMEYRHGLNRDLTQFLYANSITLTPGTLTVMMDDENITVHILDRNRFANIKEWKVGEQLMRLDGDTR